MSLFGSIYIIELPNIPRICNRFSYKYEKEGSPELLQLLQRLKR